jgi:serine/threonine-protein kinase
MREEVNDNALARVGSAITNKYRLVRLVGCGGMAAVYEGVHRNGHRVAIKILHPHLSVVSDLRARFSREGYAANRVNHRGALSVIDDDVTDDGSAFLVMELLEGETLDGRLESRGGGRGLPSKEVSEFGVQVLDVLAAAHDAGIVHRDIKPENLFLTNDGIVKVLDFGIARLREANDAVAATHTGLMMGTPAFMAPEQALGDTKQIDHQTDIWAVGATMFTLASGRYVHEARTGQEMVVHAATCPARSVLAVAPDAPPEIAAVIDRALAFEKDKRWSDARAMRVALTGAHKVAFGVPLAVPRVADADAGAVAPFVETARTARSDVAPPSPPERHPVSTTAGFVQAGEARTAGHDAHTVKRRSTRLLGTGLGLVAVAGLVSFSALRSRVAGPVEPELRTSAAPPSISGTTDVISSAAVVSMSTSKPASAAPDATSTPVGSSQPPSTDGARHALLRRVTPPSIPLVSKGAASSPGGETPPLLATNHAPPEPPPTAPAVAPHPACRVQPYFDADGNKRFRQVCP